MYARVVRFTDVTPQRIGEIAAQVEASDGPPPGVDSTGFQLLVDEAQGTAVFVGRCTTRARSSSRWTRQTPPARAPPLTSARSRRRAARPEDSPGGGRR